MSYSSVRYYEQSLPRRPPLAHAYIQSVSAAQRLAELQAEVRRLRQTESVLQAKIQGYQAQLDRVRTELHDQVNKANVTQNLLAPVSRLPNEMLLAIFEEAVANQEPGPDEPHIERVLSQVSRRWRDLVIHAPRLWRHVVIMPHVTPSILEMYKTRASRALDVDVRGWKDRRDFQRFDAALEAMLGSSERWRSLSISQMCDTNLSHLILKLSHTGRFSGLKHFSFRAQRPGQICTIPFLMDNDLSPLRSLDAENFAFPGDLPSIRSRSSLSFSKLTSLTLRRYSNDARSLRIMIDFSAFRAMVNSIPGLTSLALYGQPLRFRSHPTEEESTNLSLLYLQTLILHPGVLKPRYLQQTVTAIHAPALRHFELVFPDSKISGQNVVDLLFDSSKCPRFPLVDTVILHNASNSGTAVPFVNAFPYTTHATLGGVDVGFFPPVLHPGGFRYLPRFAYWPRLHKLTLRSTRPDTLRVVREWIRDEYDRGRTLPALVVEGSLDNPEVNMFYQFSRMYTRVELVNLSPATSI
ncbi:hypothetical protein HYDPIDRAFT_30067 [Hydnomerulius pinastri MD-312]|uniref:F-box domain-containing protein n=1 Tax=Hydnomerulius pinastri MD-312 TaxID=994086 RepID=A0A0C9WE08_9AGAM|nr:hypothetical protein HYDPIDRAFT_30067 [Hydnomerulius pinastri MD-312]